MRNRLITADANLDHARMEVQATAELVVRSLAETYRLIAQTQRQVRLIAAQATAAPDDESEAAA